MLGGLHHQYARMAQLAGSGDCPFGVPISSRPKIFSEFNSKNGIDGRSAHGIGPIYPMASEGIY
jgi:hypothetical protein